jgi:retinol-binding protein 3
MRKHTTSAVVVILGLLSLGAASLGAQGQPTPAPQMRGAAMPGPMTTLDAATRALVIDTVVATLQHDYVDPDTGRRIAEHIRRRARAGAFNAHTDPMAFARSVTEELQSINHDQHLSLSFNMPMSMPQTAPPASSAPMPATGTPQPVVVMAPPGGAADEAVRAQRANFGLRKLEILPGNIGYLQIEGFDAAAGSDSAIVGALNFLAHTDAIIIDVRRNRGGHGEMSHMLFSHFLGASPVPTIRVRNRLDGTDETLHSLATVPGPRRTDVPLYVLTSRNTVSAAEEFAFVLRNQRRAILVGDRTLGAGHMNELKTVGAGFTLSVSFARVTDPVTGAEWEQVGVQPHIQAAPEAALDVAQANALRAIASSASDPMRAAVLNRLADVAAARGAGLRATPEQLRTLPGAYTGGRRIEAQDGRLVYFGVNGATTELVPLGDGWFALNDQKVKFEGTRMMVERPDGSRYEFERTPG